MFRPADQSDSATRKLVEKFIVGKNLDSGCGSSGLSRMHRLNVERVSLTEFAGQPSDSQNKRPRTG